MAVALGLPESRPCCHAGILATRKAIAYMKLQNEEYQLCLWKKGFVLGSACYHFAPPDLRADFDKIRSAKIEEQTIVPLRDGATWPEALGAAVKHLKPYANQMRAEADTSRRLQGYLLRLIGDGHVLALGYALPRSPEDYPALIPIDVWLGTIDWPKSSVKGNGLEFVAVRVVTNRTVQDALGFSEQELLPAPKKTGRPSLKARIIEAYGALKDAGQIDFEKPMGHAFPRLRAWLSERYPNNAGQFEDIADETIRRHVSSLFKQDRKSTKQ